MSLSILAEAPADYEEWDARARADQSATFFHSPLWARLYSAYAGRSMKPDGRLLTFSDGKSAVLALCGRKILGVPLSYVSSPAGNFGGWVSGDALTVEHARLLTGRLSRLGNIVWRENPYDPCLKQIDIAGSSEDCTQAADLRQGFDTVYANWSRGHVNAVNKARRMGVSVRYSHARDDWKRHYDCYRWLRRRWKVASNDYRWKLFEKLHQSQSPQIVLWLAELDGKLLSSVVCFYWNSHAVAWHGAASPEDFKIRSNHLMYYEIMKNAAGKGIHWFDMNPSGGNRGVVEFKEHLGTVKLQSRIVVRRSGPMRLLGGVRHLVRSGRQR
jgi:hypothetical protein